MEKYLNQLPFWAQLSAGDQAAVRDCAYIRQYSPGQLIFARDQECLGLIYVISGTVRSFMLSEEGREVLLYRIHEGESDVLSASCVLKRIEFKAEMVAETYCQILIIPAVCLSGRKNSNVYLRCFLYERLGERFSEVMIRMQNMLFSRVDQRLARVLVQKAGPDGVVRGTHELLAGEISTSREVVSRVLKQMEAAGTVRLGRGSVQLLRSKPEELLP